MFCKNIKGLIKFAFYRIVEKPGFDEKKIVLVNCFVCAIADAFQIAI